MPIYVDQLIDYGHDVVSHGKFSGKWCHMAASKDTPIEELHALADSIGLKRSWFQALSSIPHYDLTPKKRRAAIEQGALEVGPREFFLECRRKGE